MTNLKIKFASAVALFCFATYIGKAQIPEHARTTLTPLRGKSAEALLKKIDRTKLPQGSVTDSVFQRGFLLKAMGAEDLGIVAIYFHYKPSEDKSAPPEQCGVFLVPQNGESSYIPVIGPDTQLGSPLCGGVRAVGASKDPGPRPRLIFIFDATNMHGKEYSSPWILSWNQASGTYHLDMPTTTWLWNQKTADTVPAIRQLLKQHE